MAAMTPVERMGVDGLTRVVDDEGAALLVVEMEGDEAADTEGNEADDTDRVDVSVAGLSKSPAFYRI